MVGETPLNKKALDQINAGAISDKGVGGLAKFLDISPRHLRRIVKDRTGSSPIRLNSAKRLYSAQMLVKRTTMSITEIAFSCEFASLRQFNDMFKQAFKMSPSDMRKHFLGKSKAV